jgi:two-component system, LytTR family, sensor kinase
MDSFMSGTRMSSVRTQRIAIAVGWALAVVVFSVQWYAYDASRAGAEPFAYYLWWSGYMWALLTPAALWMAWRHPITLATWRRSVPVHIAASLALTVIQLSLEAWLGWLRKENSLSVADALRHYFSQHTQVSLLTYWILVAAVMAYRTMQEAHAGRLRSAELQSQLTAARLEVLRRQLNPHFLFNTLQAATTLVHEDPDRAEEVLGRLGDLLRVTLRESEAQEIPLGDELAILAHYIAIQTCRFENRLEFAFNVDPDATSYLVPTLMLQPLVENAVRYGVGTHRGSDTVTISARRVDTVLNIEIGNGIGSLGENAAASEDRARAGGFGLAATRERLRQLYGETASSLQLEEIHPSGVRVRISLPAHCRAAVDGTARGTPCLSAC